MRLPSASDLLLHGFTPTYVPPDETIINLDEAAAAPQHAEAPAPSISARAKSIELSILELEERLAVAKLILEATTLVRPSIQDVFTDTLVTLPTVTEYEALLAGGANLSDTTAIEAYEAYHLGEDGTLDVWLYHDAHDLSDDLQLLKESEVITRMHEDDEPTIAEYIEYKVQRMELALSALERSIYVPSAPANDQPTIYELLGGQDPLTLAVEDMYALQRERNDLVKLYQMLKLIYHGLTIDAITSIESVRAWSLNRLYQLAEHKQAAMISKVYKVLLSPMVQKALDWEAQNRDSDIAKKFPLLSEIRQVAVEGLFTKLADVKQKLVDLAKSDRERYYAYQCKSDIIYEKKRTRLFMRQLKNAIDALELVLSQSPEATAEQLAREQLKKRKMRKAAEKKAD